MGGRVEPAVGARKLITDDFEEGESESGLGVRCVDWIGLDWIWDTYRNQEHLIW